MKDAKKIAIKNNEIDVAIAVLFIMAENVEKPEKSSIVNEISALIKKRASSLDAGKDWWEHMSELCKLASYHKRKYQDIPYLGFRLCPPLISKDQAQQYIEQVVKIWKNNAHKQQRWGWYPGSGKIADTLMEYGKQDEAIDVLVTNFMRDPTYSIKDHIEKVVRIHFKKGMRKKAADLLEEAAKKTRGWGLKAKWLSRAARILWHSNRQKSEELYEDSLEWFGKAAESSRSDAAKARYYSRILRITIKLGRREEAIRLKKEFLSQITDDFSKGEILRIFIAPRAES